MSILRKLAGQTAVYGMSSIVGRLLNYLLVPLYTHIFAPDQYGIVTELMAYVVFLQVLLTYGMETAFFRFSERYPADNRVYATVSTSLLVSSLLFALLIVVFAQPIANILDYAQQSDYIVWLGVTVAIDAFLAVPFARLRKLNKAMRFATLKLFNIGINIGINVFFLVFCPWIVKNNPNSWWNSIYSADLGIEYIFIAYFIASIATLFLLLPELKEAFSKYRFDKTLLKEMLRYAYPLLLAGLVGMANDVLGRIMLKYLVVVPSDVADSQSYIMAQVGIYGANIKIAVFMNIFIQAFRYASEPFFFAQSKSENAPNTYALVMKYFVVVGWLIFLGVTLYIDIVKYFIGSHYHEGLGIVPIMLVGYLLFGIINNLSIWYKLADKTHYGLIISFVGLLITIAGNWLLIPLYGYVGSAYAALSCYLTMTVLSYFLGNKYYPVPYQLRSIAVYSIIAVLLWVANKWLQTSHHVVNFAIATVFLLLFVAIVIWNEKLLPKVKAFIKRR